MKELKLLIVFIMRFGKQYRVRVNLIMGYSEPNDATVMKNPQGLPKLFWTWVVG